MNSISQKGLCYILAVVMALTSCNKDKFLDAKPSTKLTVPTTLTDFQTLLDNYDLMNQTPGMGDLGNDNYYYSYSSWQAVTTIPKNCYIWASDIYQGAGNNMDWNLSYQQIFVANVVLDGLKNIDINSVDKSAYNVIKGSALFFRANAFYNLAQIYCTQYDSSGAVTDPGLPLKLSSDVNITVKRASLKDTYSQILTDLADAKGLLPPSPPSANINRPVKAAVYALYSRLYLSSRAYNLAALYADSSLQLYSTLIDFNTLSSTSTVPFTRTNIETFFQSYQVSVYPLKGSSGVAIVDSLLYNSYSSSDLRKKIFFRSVANGIVLKGTHNGTFALFSGFATDEMYLNRAEGNARQGNITAAINDLNTLLSKRYVTNTYVLLNITDPQSALNTILTERRKEMPFRSLRWSDLKRLNKEGAAISLKRVLNGQLYTLPPNSPLYILPIPPDEISLSGIQQNGR